MKFGKKALVCAVSAAVAVSCGMAQAGACTGVYVGKDVSATGNAMFGRSEDIGAAYNKIFFVHEAGDHKAGETYTDGYGYSYTYKTDSLRYTAVKDDPNADDFGEFASDKLTSYEEAGTNECGVALTATVTIGSTDKIVGEEGTDPNVGTGIDEISYATILLGQAHTAREGVELLAELVAKDGAADNHCIMIGDQNEVWYMEVVSGHQYAAIKLPDDVVAVNPNINMLREVNVNDTENTIVSDKLIEVAQQAGTFVGDAEQGIIDVQQSYGDQLDGATDRTSAAGFSNGCRYRLAMGQNYLNKNMKTDPDASEFVLTFKPDRKISLADLQEFFAQHGEGTYYDGYKDPAYRSISTDRAAETHIFELREELPTDLSVVEWRAMAMSDYSVFVPDYPCLLTDTLDAYQVEGTEYTEGSAYWTFQRTAALANDDHAGVGVEISKAYDELQAAFNAQFAAQDDEMIALYATDKEAASKQATELAASMAQTALDKANELYEQYKPAWAAFTDVAKDDWFADAVSNAVENKLFSGASATTFEPKSSMTRAMLVAVLHRYAGTPAAEGESFPDVAAGAYYETAAKWAAANGVVAGSDGLLKPNDKVTRAELTAILYRYAKLAGLDVTVSADAKTFTDAASIPSWAADAMQWAADKGIVKGDELGNALPNASASRAEVAAILMRLAAVPAAAETPAA